MVFHTRSNCVEYASQLYMVVWTSHITSWYTKPPPPPPFAPWFSISNYKSCQTDPKGYNEMHVQYLIDIV